MLSIGCLAFVGGQPGLLKQFSDVQHSNCLMGFSFFQVTGMESAPFRFVSRKAGGSMETHGRNCSCTRCQGRNHGPSCGCHACSAH